MYKEQQLIKIAPILNNSWLGINKTKDYSSFVQKHIAIFKDGYDAQDKNSNIDFDNNLFVYRLDLSLASDSNIEKLTSVMKLIVKQLLLLFTLVINDKQQVHQFNWFVANVISGFISKRKVTLVASTISVSTKDNVRKLQVIIRQIIKIVHIITNNNITIFVGVDLMDSGAYTDIEDINDEQQLLMIPSTMQFSYSYNNKGG